MQKLSVYLSDKDTTTIQLLKMYLAELDYVEIIGEGESLNNNYQDIINLSPSIVIADVSGNFNDSYEFAEKILSTGKGDCYGIALSLHPSPAALRV